PVTVLIGVTAPPRPDVTHAVYGVSGETASVTVLFPADGSGWFPPIAAESVSVPSPAGVVTVIVTVALAPTPSAPREQTTVPDVCAQPPWLELAVPNEAAPGSVFVTVTPVAAVGPLFVAVRL